MIGAGTASMPARVLLAALCLLCLLGGPSPVLCLDPDGGCVPARAEAGSGASREPCHDAAAPAAPGCSSCTDVAAPEETHLCSPRPDPGAVAATALPATAAAFTIVPPHLEIRGAGPSPASAAGPPPLRTTVLLI